MAASFRPTGSLFRRFLSVVTALGLLLAGGEASGRANEPLPEGAIYRVGPSRFRIGKFVYFVAFSEDGKTLLSINRTPFSSRCVVRRWETATGKQVGQFPLPDTLGGTSRVVLAPDATLLASIPHSDKAEPIALLDAATGQVVRRFGKQIHGPDAAFSPNGRILATTDSKGAIHLWEPATGAALGKLAGADSECRALVFSSDGKLLASAHEDGSLRIWDSATHLEIRRCQREKFSCGVTGLCFAPDGKVLAAAPRFSSVELWDSTTGKQVRKLPLVDDLSAYMPTFSPSGKLLAAYTYNALYVWHTDSGKVACRLDLLPASCHCMAFSPDGKFLALGEENVALWQVVAGKEVRLCSLDEAKVFSAAFAPDGKLLATGGPDEFVRLWDANTGAAVRPFKACPDGNRVLGFTPDGRSLLTHHSPSRSYRDEFFQWELATGRKQRNIVSPGALGRSTLSPSGRFLAWQGNEGKDRILHVRDVASGKDVHAWRCDKEWNPKRARFSPDETLLAETDGFPLYRSEVWEVATGKTCAAFKDTTELAGFSPDGRVVACADALGRIHFHSARTGKEIAGTSLADVLPSKEELPSCLEASAFSPDGKMFASFCLFEPIRLWETATGKERLRIPIEKGLVSQLGFSADGNKLFRVSTEDNAVVWQLLGRAPGKEPVALSERELHTLWINLANDDGRTAFKAMQVLSATAPGPVVDFLRRELERQPPRATPRQVDRWIAELDANPFDVRENASRELAKLDDQPEPMLRKSLHDRPSPEKRKRLQALLGKLERARGFRKARGERMVEVLEHLGSPEAGDLLKSLSQKDPNARLTLAARAALERLARRPSRH